MCKKLLVFLLILGVANIASATIMWEQDVDNAWSTAGNWDLGAVPTLTGDKINICNGAVSAARIANINSAAVTSKLQLRTDDGYGVTLNLQSGSLTVLGSTEMYGRNSVMDGGTIGTGTINVAAGLTANMCTKVTTGKSTAFADMKLGGQSTTGTLNIEGTMKIESADVANYGNSKLMFGSGKTGSVVACEGILNIGAAGVVETDEVVIQDALDALFSTKIDITNGGFMEINGNQVTLMYSLRTAGKLIGDGGASGISVALVGGKTQVQVPEPATMALLGLGGLLLRKRR